ncbi:MAG: methylated-DNA--[protein]-cysteine S-methyltransferase [Brevundimonas sp.]
MTKRPEVFQLDRIATPLGEVLLVFDREGVVRAFDFEDYEDRMRRLLRLHYGAAILEAGVAPVDVRLAVTDYFSGQVQALKRIRWTTGGTAFQRRVWRALTEIPAGRTETYGQLAARIGAPTAVRAVGLANGANPVAVIVPCHRVVGSSGKLTGYAGGLGRKKWLLEHEGALKPDGAPLLL